MDCPKCLGKLEPKELRVDELHDVKDLQGAATSYCLAFDQCFVCGGVWFDKGELQKYTTDRLDFFNSPSESGDFDASLDIKEGKCPRCGIALKRTPYPQNPSITVDACDTCGGVWIDIAEIDKIESSHKEKLGFIERVINNLRK